MFNYVFSLLILAKIYVFIFLLIVFESSFDIFSYMSIINKFIESKSNPDFE